MSILENLYICCIPRLYKIVGDNGFTVRPVQWIKWCPVQIEQNLISELGESERNKYKQHIIGLLRPRLFYILLHSLFNFSSEPDLNCLQISNIHDCITSYLTDFQQKHLLLQRKWEERYLLIAVKPHTVHSSCYFQRFW